MSSAGSLADTVERSPDQGDGGVHRHQLVRTICAVEPLPLLTQRLRLPFVVAVFYVFRLVTHAI